MHEKMSDQKELVVLVEEEDEEEEAELLSVMNEKMDDTSITSIFVHTHSDLASCKECTRRLPPVERNTQVTMNITKKQLPKSYVCHDCGKMFTTRRGLTRHTLTHTGIKDAKFSKRKHRGGWSSHSDEHDISYTRDDDSDYPHTFAQKNNIARHPYNPSDPKDIFECDICGKTFKRKCHLHTHLITHSKIKKFQCTTCGKMFKRNHDLTKHALIHTDRKSFICMECGKSFARKGYLQIHKLIHSGVKNYECTQCGKMFARSSDLNKHVLTHTGERRFECSECHKTFTQPSHLKSHSLIHTQVKKFECTVCGNMSARKSDLKKHMNIHYSHK